MIEDAHRGVFTPSSPHRNTAPWQPRYHALPVAGTRITLWDGDRPASFDTVLRALVALPEAAFSFAVLLAALPYHAMRFECPVLGGQALTRPFECVALDAPELLRPADPRPFRDHFGRAEATTRILRFGNLGGDAMMIVPVPSGAESECYAHLASFLRLAPPTQVGAFFAAFAEEALNAAHAGRVWMNTAGDGVAWLHGRLDSVPKYYRYRPYRNGTPAAA